MTIGRKHTYGVREGESGSFLSRAFFLETQLLEGALEIIFDELCGDFAGTERTVSIAGRACSRILGEGRAVYVEGGRGVMIRFSYDRNTVQIHLCMLHESILIVLSAIR